MATAKTVTGLIQGPDGKVRAGAVQITLSQQAYIAGTAEVVPAVQSINVDASGAWSQALYANNDLTPNGTYYTVKITSTDGGFEQLTIQVPQTAGPFEVANLVTSTPTASPTPNHVSTLTVDGAATFTAGPVVIGTDPGGTQAFRVGGTGHLSGLLTLDGGITVTAGPVTLPAASVADAALSANVALLSGAQTISGVKTFSANPVFNASAIPESAVANLTGDLAARALDSAVVHLAGAETISGAKTFSAGVTVSGAGNGFVVNGTPVNTSVLASINPANAGGITGNTPMFAVLANTLTVTAGYASQAFTSFSAPSLTSTTAQTITNAATVSILGAPNVGGSLAITNPYALWVQSGKSQFDGPISAFAGINMGGSLNGIALNLGALNLTATAGAAWGQLFNATLNAAANNDALAAYTYNSGTVGTGTGLTGLTYYGLNLNLAGITKTGTGTITNAFGAYIAAPTIGTNNYALYVASGTSQFNGSVVIGGSAIPNATFTASKAFNATFANTGSDFIAFFQSNGTNILGIAAATTGSHSYITTENGWDLRFTSNGAAGGGLLIDGSNNVAVSGNVGFYGIAPVAQQSTTGTATGFTANAGTAVQDASTFTGGVGATAYRISDIVRALKNYGLLAA